MHQRGELPFDRTRVNNPPPLHHTRHLKFVGPHISHQLQLEQITTLQQFLDYILNHTRHQNETMMKRSLVNPRWVAGAPAGQQAQRCVGNVNAARGFRYATRRYNYMAWNALITYARNQIGADPRRYRQFRRDGANRREDRIPILLVPRAAADAFPAYCP